MGMQPVHVGPASAQQGHVLQRRLGTEPGSDSEPFRSGQVGRGTGLEQPDQPPHHPGREVTAGTAICGRPVEIAVLNDPPASDAPRR